MSADVARLTEEIVSELTSLADSRRREGEWRYFKETINNLGVTTQQVRAVERQVLGAFAKVWSPGEAMALCDALLARHISEVTQLALTFLDRFSNKMGEADFARCEAWLEDDLLDNWAAVDTLCPHVIGTILRNHPHLASRVRLWADSGNRWVRRASAVSFILLVRKGDFLDVAYEIAGTLFADKSDDLVQKGNGWMLRDAGTTDPDRLEAFLLAHGPDVPRTTLRYAIEKFPKQRRAEILVATR